MGDRKSARDDAVIDSWERGGGGSRSRFMGIRGVAPFTGAMFQCKKPKWPIRPRGKRRKEWQEEFIGGEGSSR